MGCAGAIGFLIAGNIVGAAKLLRIKRKINVLGGVAEAVQVMKGVTFSYEKMKVAGGGLGSLAAELIGIADVKEECFE